MRWIPILALVAAGTMINYLDRTVLGIAAPFVSKDLALTPFHVWTQKSTGADSTSTCIDMKSDDGRIYDIDFVTTGPQVTSIGVHRINGESLR